MIRRAVATLAGAVLPLVGAPAIASADTIEVCPSCTYTTIQQGVAAATAGDTIDVGAGAYTGTVTVDKAGLEIQGAGSDETTLSGGFVLNAAADGTVIADLAIVGTGGNGISIAAGATVDDVTVEGVLMEGKGSGLRTATGTSMSGWTFDEVTVRNGNGNGTGNGLYFQGETRDLVIRDSDFSNLQLGMYVSCEATCGGPSGVPGVFDDVTVTDTTFRNNRLKGMYFEAVSNATFTRVTVDRTGFPPPTGFPPVAGIDVNVKFDEFENVHFVDTVVTNTVGAGLTIKGRDDGNYANPPAKLTNVTFTGMTITGSTPTEQPEGQGHGIAIGNNVVGAKINGSRIVGNAAGGLYSYVTSGSPVDATDTWWGCNAGPISGSAGCDAVIVEDGTTPVVSDPWVVLALNVAGGVPVGGTLPVTASIATNSAGGPVVGLPEQEIGLSTTFGALSTSGGLTSGGQIGGTFTGTGVGFATISATLDNQTTTAGVNVFAPAPEPEPTPPPTPSTPPAPEPQPFSEPSTSPSTSEQAREHAAEILGGRVRNAGLNLGGLAQVFRRVSSRVSVPRRGEIPPVLAIGCEAAECRVAVNIVLRLRDGTRIVLPVQRGAAVQGEAVPIFLQLTPKQRRQLRRAGGATMSIEVRVNGNGERERARGRLTIRV